MKGKPFPARSGKLLAWAAGTAILALTGSVTSVTAQPALPVPGPQLEVGGHDNNPAAKVVDGTASDDNLLQTGCSSCGSGLAGTSNYVPMSGGCGSGCPSCCYAGRRGCDCCWNPKTKIGKCFAGCYECMCCPDPCYEPQWLPIADSAFFVDAARPITHMRLRWDSAWNLIHPDRAEYFQARARTTPNQVGPGGPQARPGVGKGPTFVANRIDYDDLTLYNETALGGFGFFIEMLYRDIDPSPAPISPAFAVPSSGFGDMNLGTKSMLVDCELYQLTFQFKTFLPIGNFTQGLGVGHVSLEPALLWNIKLTNDCYVQTMFAYWIPIGGDQLYQGNIFHEHFSFNKTLCKPCNDLQLIGTLEFNHWSILGGNYTSPDFLVGGAPVAVSANSDIVSIGPGIRCFVCGKIDLGVGSAFSITGEHWAQQLIRSEFRWRF